MTTLFEWLFLVGYISLAGIGLIWYAVQMDKEGAKYAKKDK